MIFVAVSDHVFGGLDIGWRNSNIGRWTTASSKEDLELMVKACIAGFEARRLGNRHGQDFLEKRT